MLSLLGNGVEGDQTALSVLLRQGLLQKCGLVGSRDLGVVVWRYTGFPVACGAETTKPIATAAINSHHHHYHTVKTPVKTTAATAACLEREARHVAVATKDSNNDNRRHCHQVQPQQRQGLHRLNPVDNSVAHAAAAAIVHMTTMQQQQQQQHRSTGHPILATSTDGCCCLAW